MRGTAVSDSDWLRLKSQKIEIFREIGIACVEVGLHIVDVENVYRLVVAHIACAVALHIEHRALHIGLVFVEFETVIFLIELKFAFASFRHNIDAKFALPSEFDIALTSRKLNAIAAANARQMVAASAVAIATAGDGAEFVVTVPIVVVNHAFVVGIVARNLRAAEIGQHRVVRTRGVLSIENIDIVGIFSHEQESILKIGADFVEFRYTRVNARLHAQQRHRKNKGKNVFFHDWWI